MPDTPSPISASAPAGVAEAPAVGTDKLAALYKMSTTSAPASTEYTAINTLAVIALLAGVASVLALFSPVLLILPAVAVVLAAVALVQIQRSSGTQTGRVLALGGMALALGLGALVGVRAAQASARNAQYRQQVADVIAQFGQKIVAADYASAYAMCSPRFRDEFPAEKFNGVWQSLRAYPVTGDVRSIRSNGQIIIDPPGAGGGGSVASAGTILTFEKGDAPLSPAFVLTQQDDQWVIDRISSLFESRPRRSGSARPPAPGGGGQ